MKDITVEMSFKVWDNNMGAHIDIAEDGDGLSLIQISYHDPYPYDNNIRLFPVIDTKMARGVAEAMLKMADYIEGREKMEDIS